MECLSIQMATKAIAETPVRTPLTQILSDENAEGNFGEALQTSCKQHHCSTNVSATQPQSCLGQALPSDIVTTAKASLARCEDLRSQATKASEGAKKAVAEAKAAATNLSHTISTIDAVISDASSFESQWLSFKKKFDDLTKMACAKLQGMGDASAERKRPAEVISEERVAQVLSRASKVVVLTGAGISSESGIPTFRGADGFWTVGSENYQPQELATWEKFNEMPGELWRWYQYRWGICRTAHPNDGHRALVDLEDLVQGGLTLVTQNIDGLHLQAGSDRRRLYEIHGRIDEMRCDERLEGACLHGVDLNDATNFAKARATITQTPAPAKEETDEHLPCCSVCGVRQRPKILWFDECYNEPIYGSRSVQDATQECDVLLVVGTQLTTGLPSNMVNVAFSKGATIIKMDTIVDLSDEKSAGMLHVQGKSGEALPRIVSELRKMRQEPALAPLAEPSGTVLVSKSLSHGAPLAGSPALSLRRKSLAAEGDPISSPVEARSAARTFASKRNSSARPGAILGTPPTRNRSSGALKAAASVSLKDCATVGAGSPVEGFFVYGTLRPDDDSGASWTKSFCEGMESDIAFLPGASLYVEGYPAVSLEQTRCSVRGCFLQPSSSDMLAAKLLEADRIEGYPDLYDRTVMLVNTLSGGSRLAYVYHRTGRTDRANCVRIADGDWLSRKRG